jgi:glutaredoxin
LAESNVQVLGISVDHIPCLQAWAESLTGINYPLLSDFWPHGEVAQRYGVLRPEGNSERAIFIVDTEGIIRYIDIHDIDLQPDNQVLFAELAKVVPGFPLDEFRPKPSGEPLPTEGLVAYCTLWCPDCNRARRWFEANQISYIEVDVTKNMEAAEQVKRWAGGDRVTPTFNIDGTVVVGWDQEKMEKMLLGK